MLVDYLLKIKKELKKIKETGDSRYIYQNELDRSYGDFKDLNRRTFADKVLHDKAFNNPKYDGYQRGLASIVYINFLIKNFQ